MILLTIVLYLSRYEKQARIASSEACEGKYDGILWGSMHATLSSNRQRHLSHTSWIFMKWIPMPPTSKVAIRSESNKAQQCPSLIRPSSQISITTLRKSGVHKTFFSLMALCCDSPFESPRFQNHNAIFAIKTDGSPFNYRPVKTASILWGHPPVRGQPIDLPAL